MHWTWSGAEQKVAGVLVHIKQLVTATPDLALLDKGIFTDFIIVILFSISCRAEHISNTSESKVKITTMYVHNFTWSYSTLFLDYSVNLDCLLLDLKSIQAWQDSHVTNSDIKNLLFERQCSRPKNPQGAVPCSASFGFRAKEKILLNSFDLTYTRIPDVTGLILWNLMFKGERSEIGKSGEKWPLSFSLGLCLL